MSEAWRFICLKLTIQCDMGLWDMGHGLWVKANMVIFAMSVADVAMST